MEMRLRIGDLREDADMTQRQVAEYLHCDQSLYSKYERGERCRWSLRSGCPRSTA